MNLKGCLVRIVSVDPCPHSFFGETLKLEYQLGCYALDKPLKEMVNIWKLIKTIRSYGWEIETCAIHPDLWEEYEFVVHVEIFTNEVE